MWITSTEISQKDPSQLVLYCPPDCLLDHENGPYVVDGGSIFHSQL